MKYSNRRNSDASLAVAATTDSVIKNHRSKLKKISSHKGQSIESDNDEIQERIVYRQPWLPWPLLFLTWLGLSIYFLM